jgi:hypothetical protein
LVDGWFNLQPARKYSSLFLFFPFLSADFTCTCEEAREEEILPFCMANKYLKVLFKHFTKAYLYVLGSVFEFRNNGDDISDLRPCLI